MTNPSAHDSFIPEPSHILPELVGPENAWLDLIERAFEVSLEAPGGEIRIHGAPERIKSVHTVLGHLQDTLASHARLSEGQVRAAIAFTKAGEGSNPATGVNVPKRGQILARTPGQAHYIEVLKRNELILATGPAGTGKTFLAVAQGVSLLLQGLVSRLVITRPAVEAGERLGFLPGALEDKIDPYLAPIWDSLFDLMGREQMLRRRAAGEIEIAPLAFMRGRTLSNAFVIVDEAQNTTRLQMKMLLTRLGYGSRMVVTGDPSQVDLPDATQSGLLEALDILADVEGITTVHLTAKDIVRHALVGRIVAAYDAANTPNA